MNRRLSLMLKVLSLAATVAFVPACEDDDDDDGPPAAGGGGTPGRGNGAGSLQFSAPTYTVNESDGSVTLRVTRTGGSSGEASVWWQTDDDTAGAADFAHTPGARQITWAAGDSADKEIVIPIAQDSLNEGTERFYVFLGSNRGASLGGPNVAQVDIIDDESTPGGVFQFGATTYAVDERAAVVTITVNRSGGAAGAVSAEVRDTPQGAGPQDYAFPADPVVLSWNDGETGAKSFDVPITPDNAVEGEERFQLTLSSPAGQTTTAVGSPASATVVITDDDSPGLIEFNSGMYDVAETGGSIVIALRRRGGSQGAVSVVVSATGGTATQGADYTLPPTTVSWADGDMLDKTVSIAVHADGAVEGSETVELSLGSPTGGATPGSGAVLNIHE